MEIWTVLVLAGSVAREFTDFLILSADDDVAK